MNYLLDTCVVSEIVKRQGMTLVTRNVRDMADFGVEIFNPFGD